MQSANVISPIYVVLQNIKKYQNFHESWDLKTSSRPFCVCKELNTTSIRK